MIHKVLEVEIVAVVETARQRGIGTALLTHLEDHVASRDPALVAKVLAGEPGILRWYRHRGDTLAQPNEPFLIPAPDGSAGLDARTPRWRLAVKAPTAPSPAVPSDCTAHDLAPSRPLLSGCEARLPRVERIVVIGCGGSGKTRLARQLAGLLCLPLTHLDGMYYDAEWHTLSQEAFAARQRELVGQTRWVIDGR